MTSREQSFHSESSQDHYGDDTLNGRRITQNLEFKQTEIVLHGKHVSLIFAGSGSTGKSSLAENILELIPTLEPIHEIARTVIRERGWSRDDLLDPSQTVLRDLQYYTLSRQIEEERQRQHVSFCSDRSIFDPLVYAQIYFGNSFRQDLENVPGFHEAASWYRSDRYFLFILKPHREILHDDGIRIGLQLEEAVWFNGVLKDVLSQHEVPYIQIDELDKKRRQQSVLQTINAKFS